MMLVNANSAIEHRENEDTILAKADHTKIAKFDRYQGSIYAPIRAKIQRCLACAAPVVTSSTTDDLDSHSDAPSMLSSYATTAEIPTSQEDIHSVVENTAGQSLLSTARAKAVLDHSERPETVRWATWDTGGCRI
jgi:hypothetical protein